MLENVLNVLNVPNLCFRLSVSNPFIRLSITYSRLRYSCLYQIRLFLSNSFIRIKFVYSYQNVRSFASFVQLEAVLTVNAHTVFAIISVESFCACAKISIDRIRIHHRAADAIVLTRAVPTTVDVCCAKGD